MEEKLSPSVLTRLLLYNDYLQDLYVNHAQAQVSSAELAKHVQRESSLVRRDLSTVGIAGTPRKGYHVASALEVLQDVLGMASWHRAVLFGAGRLGTALLAQDWQQLAGVTIVAAFEQDSALSGTLLSGVPVLPVDEAPGIIAGNGVDIAILAVSGHAAQACAELAVKAGVTGIWSFAPGSLELPRHVSIRQENLAAGLIELLHMLPKE